MSPLLEQFLSEARDLLQGIGEKLMLLEDAPGDRELMADLFRLVHTLKGNSGLFEFPAMTRVLHAGEDLMDAIRNGQVGFSREIADRLLDAMDFVGHQCDEIEGSGGQLKDHPGKGKELAESLRALLPVQPGAKQSDPGMAAMPADTGPSRPGLLDGIPESARMAGYLQAPADGLRLVRYVPSEDCFFGGDDPFHQARLTPGQLWGGISAREPWPRLEELDAYRCMLDFQVLSLATLEELEDHYRYVIDQVEILELTGLSLALPQGDPNGGPVYEDFVAEAQGLLQAGELAELGRAATVLLELSNPDLWLSSALRWLLAVLGREPENRAALRALIDSLTSLRAPDWAAQREQPLEPEPVPAPARPEPAAVVSPELAASIQGLIAIQRRILAIGDGAPWQPGRIQAAATTLASCLKALGQGEALEGFDAALGQALFAQDGALLLRWLDGGTTPPPVTLAPLDHPEAAIPAPAAAADPEVRFGRRADDSPIASKSLKVDQAKVDRLMNLIGEMVVSKNALPYLAGRAESVFGVRELSREIKAQYAVINRIAEEMQDAIMQVRMMPVSFVFQRFHRLVRDLSRKLGKEVNLVLIGEDTQADKNIIEALGDPLVHIVRNSLDHGLEQPEARRAAGKPVAGTLTLRATQESDRVLIEIEDDGRGIDPAVIKAKALERGLIDAATCERISDQEALNLIFAAGLSTAETITDVSGRGVGMDVVRSAVEKVNGSIRLDSELGKGTRITLSLPLSMAVTNVMIVESDGQRFGLPMDSVIETVRLPAARITTIKHSQATLLRGRIVALKSLNALLGLAAQPRLNADGELAVLVVRIGNEPVGLIVDQFHEAVDIILKPMAGVLGGLSAYAGSALMGDGSVLMVLNIAEVL